MKLALGLGVLSSTVFYQNSLEAPPLGSKSLSKLTYINNDFQNETTIPTLYVVVIYHTAVYFSRKPSEKHFLKKY